MRRSPWRFSIPRTWTTRLKKLLPYQNHNDFLFLSHVRLRNCLFKYEAHTDLWRIWMYKKSLFSFEDIFLFVEPMVSLILHDICLGFQSSGGSFGCVLTRLRMIVLRISEIFYFLLTLNTKIPIEIRDRYDCYGTKGIGGDQGRRVQDYVRYGLFPVTLKKEKPFVDEKSCNTTA